MPNSRDLKWQNSDVSSHIEPSPIDAARLIGFKSYLLGYNIYIIINVRSGGVCGRYARIWACDSSLEPSCHQNDHVMGENRLARTARPQCTKMCFLLHKTALSGRFVTDLGRNDFAKIQSHFTRCAPACDVRKTISHNMKPFLRLGTSGIH